MNLSLDEIRNCLLRYCDQDLLFQSRIQRLPSFETADCQVFAKREDESGFGVSGCKRRKYASLIPFLLKEKAEEVLVIGGSHSNHVVSVLQLLIENRIPARLFLKESHSDQLRGNSFLLHLLKAGLPVHSISSSEWEEVDSIAARAYPFAFLITEGGSCKESVPGLCSLFTDILRNEQNISKQFDHIFIDSGTGMTAGVLHLLNGYCGRKSIIHIVRVAASSEFLRKRLKVFSDWLRGYFPLISENLDFPVYDYPSASGRSFGSLNTTILQTVREIAVTEGILTDPVYTAKLFYTAKIQIVRQKLKGKILIIHSGGGTGLTGFSEKFR